MSEQGERRRADAAGAWNQTVLGFQEINERIFSEAVRWQQDLVRLWADTQQQLAGFWRAQQETAEQTAGHPAGDRGAGGQRPQQETAEQPADAGEQAAESS
ncbi:MAG: hypothetical protein M3133_00820 [Actinomycetota bacterium]|nr:hypothetical protein [Actinomycetota bacterium]